MTAPKDGITVAAHVRELLAATDHSVSQARRRVEEGRRLTKTEREEFRLTLAGAIGNLEIVRLWLATGAPE